MAALEQDELELAEALYLQVPRWWAAWLQVVHAVLSVPTGEMGKELRASLLLGVL